MHFPLGQITSRLPARSARCLQHRNPHAGRTPVMFFNVLTEGESAGPVTVWGARAPAVGHGPAPLREAGPMEWCGNEEERETLVREPDHRLQLPGWPGF